MGGERIGLVGCVKTKRAVPAPARDLYTSTLFTGRRAFVERTCDRWFILSARHGLLAPDTVLEPYEQALADAGHAARRRWSDHVLAQIDGAVRDVAGVVFEVHAGAAYRDFGLVDGLRSRRAWVEIPTQGLAQGQQLAFYKTGRSSQTTSPAHPVGRGWAAPDRPLAPATTRSSPAGKYARLAELLRSQTAAGVTLAFGDIEAVLGAPLPASARKHRPWWANTPASSQARAWLNAGWQVASVDLTGEHVSFTRRR